MAHWNLTSAGFNKKFNDLKAKKYRMIDIEAYSNGGTPEIVIGIMSQKAPNTKRNRGNQRVPANGQNPL